MTTRFTVDAELDVTVDEEGDVKITIAVTGDNVAWLYDAPDGSPTEETLFKHITPSPETLLEEGDISWYIV